MEIIHNQDSKMYKEYPVIRKCGAISPYGESSPFTWKFEDGKEKLMWLELVDPSRGVVISYPSYALVRDMETGEVISRVGDGCYYHSFYQENGVAYVLATVPGGVTNGGDEIVIFESTDLKNWSRRTLFKRPGWRYYNTSLTKSPDGYVLLMEADEPVEFTGNTGFSFFFATSSDLKEWKFMPDELGFSKNLCMGGPYMRYSRGWYYVISVTCLPYGRFSNYIYRTRDFRDWYVGDYNPVLMPSNEDRMISPYAHDITDEAKEMIRHCFNCNNSDMDMCDYKGRTVITYGTGNQMGSYFQAVAVYDGCVDDFLAAFFE